MLRVEARRATKVTDELNGVVEFLVIGRVVLATGHDGEPGCTAGVGLGADDDRCPVAFVRAIRAPLAG